MSAYTAHDKLPRLPECMRKPADGIEPPLMCQPGRREGGNAARFRQILNLLSQKRFLMLPDVCLQELFCRAVLTALASS